MIVDVVSAATSSSNMAKENLQSFLVIGYGNPLRGDDGIGQQVAEQVERWNLPNVQTQAVHQLTPEIAADLAGVDCAIFVDACIMEIAEWAFPGLESPTSLQVLRIQPDDSTGVSLGHYANPRSLLALTQALYSYCPQAWLISVPGINFELGERLSPFAQSGVVSALEKVDQLLGKLSNLDRPISCLKPTDFSSNN